MEVPTITPYEDTDLGPMFDSKVEIFMKELELQLF
jgi:hypothetical protein